MHMYFHVGCPWNVCGQIHAYVHCTCTMPYMYMCIPVYTDGTVIKERPWNVHGQIHVLGCAVLPCFVVCLTLLASFFLPSHLSLKHVPYPLVLVLTDGTVTRTSMQCLWTDTHIRETKKKGRKKKAVTQATQHTQGSQISKVKMSCLGWDLNRRHSTI